MDKNIEQFCGPNKRPLPEDVKKAQWILENYTLRNLPLSHNQYYLLHRYFDEVEKNNAKLMTVLALSFVRNMTSIFSYGDYFALLDLFNLAKTMTDAGRLHSAKRLYQWAKDWAEEYKETEFYQNLDFAVKEMEQYIEKAEKSSAQRSLSEI